MKKLRIVLNTAFLVGSLCSQVQISAQSDIPSMRKMFHEEIDITQKKILGLDGESDNFWNATSISEVNKRINQSVIEKVDAIQKTIEADTSLDNNLKMKFLRGLNDMLTRFVSGYKAKAIQPVQLINTVKAYQEAMPLEQKGKSIVEVVDRYELEVGKLLTESFAFQKNPGLRESKELLVIKSIERNPERALPILMQNPEIVVADSLIRLAAYKDPETLYTYAAAPNALGSKIAKIDDSLVVIISKLAKMKTGRQYFPFLDQLYKGKISMEDISAVMNDDIKYYKLLVKTEIEYADRRRQLDTPLIMQSLTNRLRTKAKEVFVTVINGLHDESDEVRFKILTPLTAEELYYLPIMAETEIYTSSYLGVYKRIFQRMKYPNSDTLLLNVKFDGFKKFIKMAAGYNTLDDFLKRMDKSNAELLMRAFVNGLDKTGDLEDAVDVADSYASIYNADLRKLIVEQVQDNLSRTTTPRGKRIYDILHTIFISKDSTNVGVFDKLGIPPVYVMPNKLLRDTAGRIVMQQYFYGDKDGQTIFGSFLRHFSGSGWKITPSDQWVAVSSTKGVPVTIYANRPLDEQKNLDAKAQQELNEYLEQKNLKPSVVIHRGHSYYTNATIQQLTPSAKIVFLGSCGGYHNLDDVLKISPQAHIIASKQVGSGTINQPLLDYLAETLKDGKDLNWPSFWANLSRQFKNNELFDDYVPPHKNLGAIFIMAYKQSTDRDL